jgi:hypothetical protein
MNKNSLSAHTNAMFGNNVMNPMDQQQRWMSKPTGDGHGLDYLKPLQLLTVKQTVSMAEGNKAFNMNFTRILRKPLLFILSNEWSSI